MKHRSWIVFSGFLWFAIGMLLLYKGLRFLSEFALSQSSSFSFQIRLAVALLIGFIKGRFVLAKTVRRVVARIASLPLPISLMQAYSPSYWVLIASMGALGALFRFLPIPIDIRGMIDVAIGSALIHGAMLYFRASTSTYGSGSLAKSP